MVAIYEVERPIYVYAGDALDFVEGFGGYGGAAACFCRAFGGGAATVPGGDVRARDCQDGPEED